MAPKKITVEGVGVKLSSNDGLGRFLEKENVKCLIDSDGDQVYDFESIEDGGTYTLGPPQQQQQQTPERGEKRGYQPWELAGVVEQAVKKAFDEHMTETAIMSKATPEFTNSLLSDLGYAISMKPREERGTVQHHTFDWEPSEEARTPAAGERLTELIKPQDLQDPLEIVPVTGYMLREVKQGKRKARGKTDLRVAAMGWEPPTGNVFSETRGLVELKIPTNPFSESQLHLELVSASFMSAYGQGVALLATDCLGRWGIWSFERKNVISGVWYRDSTEALKDFKALMVSARARRDRLQLPTVKEGGAGSGGNVKPNVTEGSGSGHEHERDRGPSETSGPAASCGGFGAAGRESPGGAVKTVTARYEQDLSGFEEVNKSELEAFEREQFLTAFAAALRHDTGEECTLPCWARAGWQNSGA